MISIGTGIYLAASIIDHSCDPNAVAVFKNTQIFIRNTKPMSSLNWSQVIFSRNINNNKTWGFICFDIIGH